MRGWKAESWRSMVSSKDVEGIEVAEGIYFSLNAGVVDAEGIEFSYNAAMGVAEGIYFSHNAGVVQAYFDTGVCMQELQHKMHGQAGVSVFRSVSPLSPLHSWPRAASHSMEVNSVEACCCHFAFQALQVAVFVAVSYES